MSDPFLAEIRIMSFGFAPKGWALCNGQILPIQQNVALFSLIGTFYGGDGDRTFALPDLQGRVAVHQGGSYGIGSTGGEPTHTLTTAELPAHTHALTVTNNPGTTTTPAGNTFAQAPLGLGSTYGAVSAGSPATGMVSATGGNEPHENHQPYTALNFSIALFGIFPSQN